MAVPSSYARILAHHPYVVIGIISVVVVTCLIVIGVVAKPPDWTNPIEGLTARGTEISNRMIASENILNITEDGHKAFDNLLEKIKDKHSRNLRSLDLNPKTFPKTKTIQPDNPYYTTLSKKLYAKFVKNDQKIRKSMRKSRRKGIKRGNRHRRSIYKNMSENYMDAMAFNEKYFVNETSTRMTTSPHQSIVCDQKPNTKNPRLAFETVDHSSLLTTSNMRDICILEKRIIASYPSDRDFCTGSSFENICCVPWWSLSQIILKIVNKSKCEDIDDSVVQTINLTLFRCYDCYRDVYSDPESKRFLWQNEPSICKNCSSWVFNLFEYLIDTDFIKNNKLTYALTFLPQYKNKSGSIHKSLDFFHVIESQSLTEKNVHIIGARFDTNSKSTLFNQSLRKDMVWLSAAGSVVFIAIWLFSSSFFVTFMTFLAMFWSLEIAFFLYTFVYEIDFFPFVNLMTVVLVIGIGADDALIVCRVWHTAKSEKNNGTLEKIVSDTLRHSVLSMLVTSLTTAAALFANYISNVTAVKCFSIFAGTAILANYIFMITWLPAALVIYKKWCSCCFCVVLDTPSPKFKICNYLCRLPFKWYYFILNYSKVFFEKLLPSIVIKLRLFFLILFVCVAVANVIFVFYYPRLQLSESKEPQLFTKNHLMDVYDTQLQDRFMFEKPEKIKVVIVWGIKPEDNGNQLDPKDKGELVFSDTYSLYNNESQHFLSKFWSELQNTKFYKTSSQSEVDCCFLTVFSQSIIPMCCKKIPYTKSELIRCGIESSSVLYLENTAPGLINNIKIKAISLIFMSNVSFSMKYSHMDSFYKELNNFMQDQISKAPPSMRDGWFTSEKFFFYDLQKTLISGIPMTVAVSMVIAGIVCFLTTLNVLISIYSLITVIFIINVTIGSLTLLGWKLSISESIIITLSVGISFDYTLHYGVAYRLSPEITRTMRVVTSIQQTGSPVTMAAITTFLAGLTVLPAKVYVYQQLGIFLMINTIISWVYSTVFFHAMLSLIGPQSAFGQFHWPSLECCSSSSSEHQDKTVYTKSESTVSSSTSASIHPHRTSDCHELEPVTHENNLTVYHLHNHRRHDRQRQPVRLHYYNYNTSLQNANDDETDEQNTTKIKALCDSPIMVPKHSRTSVVTFDSNKSETANSPDEAESSNHILETKIDNYVTENKTNSNNNQIDGEVCTAEVYSS